MDVTLMRRIDYMSQKKANITFVSITKFCFKFYVGMGSSFEILDWSRLVRVVHFWVYKSEFLVL